LPPEPILLTHLPDVRQVSLPVLDAADVLHIFRSVFCLQSIEVNLELAEGSIKLSLPAVSSDCDPASSFRSGSNRNHYKTHRVRLSSFGSTSVTPKCLNVEISSRLGIPDRRDRHRSMRTCVVSITQVRRRYDQAAA